MRYYKACYNDSVRLLALLRGNTNSSIKVHDNFEEIAPGIKIEKIDGIKTEYTANEYWNGDVPEHEFEQYLQKYGLIDYSNTNNEKQVFIKLQINKSEIFVGEQISAISKIYIKNGVNIQRKSILFPL